MLADHKQIYKRTTMMNYNRSAALRRPAMKILRGEEWGEEGAQLVCGRPNLALRDIAFHILKLKRYVMFQIYITKAT